MKKTMIFFFLLSTFLLNIFSFAKLEKELFKAIRSKKIQNVKKFLATGANVQTRDINLETPLHQAIYSNYTIVELLLKKGANPNAQNKSKEIPLHHAVRLRKEKIIKLLIKYNSNVNATDQFKRTPLHLTLHYRIIKSLVEAGADVNAKTERGETPLLKAVSRRNKRVIQYYLSRGAKIDVKDREKMLFAACFGNHKFLVEKLLKLGVNVNAKNKYDRTPLFGAINKKADIEIIKLLINSGADIHIRAKRGESLLNTAASFGKQEIIKLLLSKGMNINEWENTNPLFNAIKNKHKEVALFLIEKGIKIDEKSYFRGTILHYAALLGYKDVIEKLLEKGFNINAKDLNKNTAIVGPAEKGNDDMARFLIDKGISIKILKYKKRKKGEPYNSGYTLLHAACMGNMDWLVKKIMKQKINLNRLGYIGMESDQLAPLHLVAIQGYTEIAKILLKKRANVNLKANTMQGINWTALHFAAKNNHIDMVKLLLKYKANKRIKIRKSMYNMNGWTPYIMAKKYKRREIMKLLKR